MSRKKRSQPEEASHDFSESIDYSDTGRVSIWGMGEQVTRDLIDKEEITGKWLNLAAGDGRYNVDLLKKATQVIATDIDENALKKLINTTPKQYRSKLKTRIFDVTKKFALKDNEVDGVFCTGTLHLFKPSVLKNVFNEIDRVLKPSGKIIIDFATDIKRVLPTGELYFKPNECKYKFDEAKDILKKAFKKYELELYKSGLSGEKVSVDGHKCIFGCKFILLLGKK